MGWTAQYFTQIILAGLQSNEAILIYDGPAGPGTLIGSWAPQPFFDPFGNFVPQGINLIDDTGNAQSLFTVTDSNGNSLATIDGLGNIVGTTVTANDDLIIDGQSWNDDIAPTLSQGIITRGWAPASSGGLPWPVTAIGATEVALLELDFILPPGSSYIIKCLQSNFIPTISASTQYVARLRFTTDGTTPTTSSAQFSGYSPAVVAVGLTGLNFLSPATEVPVSNITGADIQYRVLLTGQMQAGSCKFQSYLQMVIEDGGSLNNLNQGTILGSGTSGGNSSQTITTTYTPINVARWQGSTGHQPNALIDTGGRIQQGGDFANTFNGDSKSLIFWPASIATDLAGATVNWVKLSLVNQHTWYNSGGTCQVGHTTQINIPGSQPDPASLNDQVNQHFNKGQTLLFTVDNNGSTWGAAFQSGGARSTMMAANTSNLNFYMYFAGMSSKLLINYTK